ncbi:hypothetical protein [Phenylobacterium soli]|uniref:Uncharacterized protein n=1 Tax=Phenylobacterium soli TaxID=2170551 RepID=A0A328AGA8_9CAUL|nr:hypothetical protein [Phenylobacterium soli]RAK53146.1 hypothetical protein DJ017_00660 [Phenylobacterium soli]
MSDSVIEDIDDVLPPEPNGELVHWMEPRPISLGATGISLATAAAFALGALTTLGVLAAVHWLGPRRARDD